MRKIDEASSDGAKGERREQNGGRVPKGEREGLGVGTVRSHQMKWCTGLPLL